MLKYHIQTIEVGASPAGSILFNSIPDEYDDLLITHSLRSNESNTRSGLILSLNGSNSVTVRTILGYNGTSVLSSTVTDGNIGGVVGNTATANTFSNGQIYIANYRSATSKSISSEAVQEQNAADGRLFINASLFSTTSPITSVSLACASGPSFIQYSSVSLYGIKRGSSGEVEVASGGVITQSGGYTIHTFTSSGTFVANRDLQVETLVVAGGGGGGNGNGGGGGGAGGVLESTAAVSSGSYSVIVGAGGGTAADGNDSIFASLRALKGGKGGSALAVGTAQNDGTGLVNTHGSGGGVGRERITVGVGGGLGTPGQGNNGGNSDYGGYTAGGGGGAGAVGQNALTDENRNAPGGDGGIGVQSSLSGSSVYYGGGGGACGYQTVRNPAGGLGGGGRGSMRDTGSLGATAGTANTGGGGGGGGTGAFKSNGQAGGSGIVIIRYLTPA